MVIWYESHFALQRQKFVHLNESIMALGTYFMQGTAKSISVPRDKLPANLGQWWVLSVLLLTNIVVFLMV